MMSVSKMNTVGFDAIKVFTKLHLGSTVHGGPKALPNGDAFYITCEKTKYRVVVLIQEDSPGQFYIASVDLKDPDAESKLAPDVFPVDQLTVELVLTYMEQGFAK
ncbi:hypothetical protein NTD82_14075 [Pseudomonas sp. 5P_5.1_Bac1]|nr:hypothetical protein [Pseudomonas sp. 5P_5.1_Bac1]